MAFTESQELAVNHRHGNVIVSAGAGSGKTFVLSNRVYEIVKDGTPVNQLLILTFTNLAAYNMRNSIKKQLAKDEKTKCFVESIESANITTFDAYALSLTKTYYYLIEGLSKDISIMDQSFNNKLSEEIIDQIIEEKITSKDQGFLSLFNKIVHKDVGQFKNLIPSLNSIASLYPNKEKYLKSYLENELNENKILTLIADTYSYFQKKIIEYGEIFDYYLQNNKIYSKWSKNYELILNASSLEELIEVAAHFDTLRVTNIDSELKKEFKDIKQSFKNEIIDTLKSFKSLENIKNGFYASKNDLSTLIELTLERNKRLIAKEKELKSFTFDDIFHFALDILSNDEVADQIKQQYKYIMIDEYQDTSILQDAFISRIENNNVFMVGDIKQSIYRFRNANPKLFAKKYDLYSKNKNGTKIDLVHNFRSRQEVVEDINKIFSNIMTDDLGSANYKQSHITIAGGNHTPNNEDNHFEIYNVVTDGGSNERIEKEACVIVQDIKTKIENQFQIYDKDLKNNRSITYADFCLLSDHKSNFETYKKIFDEYGIPLVIEKETGLLSSDSIQVLINLVKIYKFISKKEFNEEYEHCFISVLRSFLFEESDANLYNITKNKSFNNHILYSKVDNVAQKNYQELSKIILDLLEVTDFEYCLIKTGRGKVEQNFNKIQFMYEMAYNLENYGFDIDEYITYLTSIINNHNELDFPREKVEGNVAHMMTIHASKGLEYPIVYVCDISHGSNNKSSNLSYNEKYGFYMKDDTNIGSILCEYENHKEDCSERLRLLYVAVTRAIDKFIIVNSLVKKPDDKCLMRFMLECGVKCKETLFDGDIAVHNVIYDDAKKSSKKMIFKNLQIEDKEVIIKTRASKIIEHNIDQSVLDYGNYLHYCLELVDLKLKDTSFIEDDKTRHYVEKFLNIDLLKNVNNASIYKEYQFNDSIHNINGIIDLMIVYDNHIDIIDYKASKIDDVEYHKQLYTYKDYVIRVFNKPVNLYLYSIMKGEIKNI